MSNGILNRQNEDSSIAMLAAQRELYKQASKLDTLFFLLSVVFPVFISLVKGWGDSWNWVQYVSYCLSIGMLFTSVGIQKKEKERKQLAASIQMVFDTYVFQMPWDKRLFGEKKNLSSDIAKNSKKIISKEEEKQQLFNWYTSPIDEMPIEKGILCCQRENCNWDIGLRKRFRIGCIILSSLLCVLIIVLGIARNEPVQEWIVRIVFILPIANWLRTLWCGLNDDIDRLKELRKIICSDQDKEMDVLQVIQKQITDHRKASVKVPDWFYKVFKKADEDTEYRIAALERNN